MDQLILLKKENKSRKADLKQVNQDMVESWMKNIRLYGINPYDEELCYKEIISFAAAKESEYKVLDDYKSDHPKLQEMLKKCRKKSWLDYLLFDVRLFAGVIAVTVFLMDLIMKQLSEPLNLSLVIFSVVLTAALIAYRMIVVSAGAGRFRSRRKPEWIYIADRLVYLLIILVPFMAAAPFEEMPFRIKTGVPGIVFPIVCGMIWVILSVFRKNRIKTLAQESLWKEE